MSDICEELSKDKRVNDGPSRFSSSTSSESECECDCSSPFCEHWMKGADAFYLLRVRGGGTEGEDYGKSGWLFPLGKVDEVGDASLRMMIERIVEWTVLQMCKSEDGVDDGRLESVAGKLRDCLLRRLEVSRE